MTGEIKIEQQFRQFKFAYTGFSQTDQCPGIKLTKGYMFGDFNFTYMQVEISQFHSLNIRKQLFTCEQSFLKAVPISKLDERAIHSQLVSKTALRALGYIIG